jgi:dethiobiotin synthetase
MSRGFFITGTDTGVGKTVITAALIKAAGTLGFRACGMKPIETGCRKQKFKVRGSRSKVPNPRTEASSTLDARISELIPADGMFLREIGRMDDPIDLVTPVRFEKPLAPLPASEIEGVPVDLDKIRIAYSELAGKYDAVIIEGIGGILVPIKSDYFVLDLAKAFALPVIVVSRPGLGTINHTILTVNYAIKEGIRIAGIIVNYGHPSEGTLAEDTNAEVIREVSPAPVIGIFPYLENLEGGSIERAAVNSLDLQIIRKYLVEP